MSKFHSTMSRRDFMKRLGLGAAGLGTAAVVGPNFHDLDELKSASQKQFKLPWYVKQVDQPTIEIDWTQVVRSDKKINGHAGIPYGTRLSGGDKFMDPVRKPAEDLIKKHFPNWKGDTLRDAAVYWGTKSAERAPTSFEMPKKAPPPDAYGLPRYEGTPEENYIMVRNLVRMMSPVPLLGVVALDQNTRKIFWDNTGVKNIVFEDAPEAYQTTTKMVIPNKNQYLLTAPFYSPQVGARRHPSLQSTAGELTPIANSRWTQNVLQEFFYALGYEGNTVYNIVNATPSYIVSGTGENSRQGFNAVNAAYGSMSTGFWQLVTNFPMEPTGPIDGGVTRFCKSCKICAEMCAYGAIGFDDDISWDHTAIPGSPPGFKGWRYDAMACAHCGCGCVAVCPFNGPKDSWIHTLAAATVATTPIFDSFFASMERTFGYGMWDPESFWTEDNAPLLGYSGSFLNS